MENQEKILDVLSKIHDAVKKEPKGHSWLFKVFYIISTILLAGGLSVLDFDHNQIVKIVDLSSEILTSHLDQVDADNVDANNSVGESN